MSEFISQAAKDKTRKESVYSSSKPINHNKDEGSFEMPNILMTPEEFPFTEACIDADDFFNMYSGLLDYIASQEPDKSKRERLDKEVFEAIAVYQEEGANLTTLEEAQVLSDKYKKKYQALYKESGLSD